jgi:hypothetical protein
MVLYSLIFAGAPAFGYTALECCSSCKVLRLFGQWMKLPRPEIACAVPDIASRWPRLLACWFRLHGTNVFLRPDFVSCRRQINFYRTNIIIWWRFCLVCGSYPVCISVWALAIVSGVSVMLFTLSSYLRDTTSISPRLLPWTSFPVHHPLIILRCSYSLSQCFSNFFVCGIFFVAGIFHDELAVYVMLFVFFLHVAN